MEEERKDWTLDDVFYHWERWVLVDEAMTKESIVSYASAYRRRVLKGIGTTMVRKVTNELVQDWVRRMTDKGVSQALVALSRSALNGVMRYAREELGMEKETEQYSMYRLSLPLSETKKRSKRIQASIDGKRRKRTKKEQLKMLLAEMEGNIPEEYMIKKPLEAEQGLKCIGDRCCLFGMKNCMNKKKGMVCNALF